MLSLLVTAIVARILSPRDFGVFAVALVVQTVLVSVGQGSISAYLNRSEVDIDEVASTVAAIALMIAVFIAATMALAAPTLASALGAPSAVGPLRVLCLAILLEGCFPVPCAVLAREFRQREVFVATLSGQIPSYILLIILAASGVGAVSFAWAVVFGWFITGVMSYVLARRFDLPVFRRDVARRVLRFGGPLAGANLVTALILNADFAIVGRTLGPIRLGLYQLAFYVASWPTALMGAMLTGVALPAFSQLRGGTAQRDRAVFTSTRLVALVAFPICAVTCALSLPLVVTVYGAKWAPSAPVLSTLAVYGAAAVLCLLFSQVIVGQGLTRLVLVLQLVWLAALVPAMIIGVHARGIVGAGDAHVVVIVAVVLPMYLVALSRSGIAKVRLLIRAVLPALLGAIVCGVAARLVAMPFASTQAKLLAGAPTGVLVYAFVMSPLLSASLLRHISPTARLWPVARLYGALGRAYADALRGVLRVKPTVGRP